MIDTIRHVATPEGVELDLRIAGPVPRAYAWLVDFLLRTGAAIALISVLAFLGRAGQGIFLILWFLIEWFYPVVFEVWRGATPGKQAFDLVVLHDDGTPVNLASSLTRNLLRFVDFLPFLYAFGLVFMLLSRDSKRLGDMAAGTIVVYRDRAPALPQLPAVTGPLAPHVALKPAEAKSVIDFAARAPSLSAARAEELGSFAPALTTRHARNPAEGVGVLLRMAHHLAGNTGNGGTAK